MVFKQFLLDLPHASHVSSRVQAIILEYPEEPCGFSGNGAGKQSNWQNSCAQLNRVPRKGRSADFLLGPEDQFRHIRVERIFAKPPGMKSEPYAELAQWSAGGARTR